MKRKKYLAMIIPLSLALTISATSIYAQGADPSGEVKETSVETIKKEFKYLSFEGHIKEVREGKNSLSVLVEKDGGQDTLDQIVFNIWDDTSIIDQNSQKIVDSNQLKEGLKVEVFYKENTPMAMSLPPIMSPDLLVIKSDQEKGFIKVGKFDENLLSVDGALKLNISDDSKIENEKGQPLKKEDIYHKDAIVFYTITTRSLPPQTTPEKIIVLNEKGKDEGSDITGTDDLSNIIGEDYYEKEGLVMIPLSKVADHLGYEIEWNAENQNILLKKGNRSISLTVGKAEYGVNRSIRTLPLTPEIKDQRTYVAKDLLNDL